MLPLAPEWYFFDASICNLVANAEFLVIILFCKLVAHIKCVKDDMPKIKEVVLRLQDIGNRTRQVQDILPTSTQAPQDYERTVLHAGAESLRLIDRLMNGEHVHTRPILNSEADLEDYIRRMVAKDESDPLAAGEYVVVKVGEHRFLGTASLVKRDFTIDELREAYRVDKAYPDAVIIQAKENGQLEMTEDVGVQVRFSLMPLRDIQEVTKLETRNAKLAASAAATNIMTSSEAARTLQAEFEEDCHDESPNFSIANTHFITPMAMALSAASDAAQLDRVLTATTLTTAATTGSLNPTLAETLHLHDVQRPLAQKQTQAVGETGLLGGITTDQLTFWLGGWNKVIDGLSQSGLRKTFQVEEILPENTIAVAQNLNDFESDEKLELTVVTGTALTATDAQSLEQQVNKIGNRRNLLRPVRQVFTAD